MQKTLDNAAVRLSLFIILLIWIDYLIGNFWISAVLGGLTTFVFVLILNKISEKRSAVKYDKEKFYRQLVLGGSDYVCDLMLKTPVVPDATVFAAFRYSVLTPDDVAASYRKSIAEDTEKIIIVCKTAPRSTRIFAASVGKPVEIIDAPAFFKLLKNSNALPPITDVAKQKIKFDFKAFIDTALSEANAKFYLFTGVILAFMTYLTPLKIYYIVLSSGCLILAALCKILKK